ncbi:MAG: VIT1/CCC1 transporter family protein [Ferruginibacter sp.]|nr:VIT1/CCC1 transporter family protein [Ferruginibacter sp.]
MPTATKNRINAVPASLFFSGIMDGVLLTLSLWIGMAFAKKPESLILDFIPWVIIPFSCIMAIGSYAARKGNEKNTIDAEEREWNRTKKLLNDWGLSTEEQLKAKAAWSKEMKEWDTIMIQADDKRQFILTEPLLLFTGVMTGSALLLLPFSLYIPTLLKISLLVIVSFILLFFAGFLASKYNHQPPLPGGWRALGYGIIAPLLAMLIALLFK